jgi:hypothetical protein
VEVGMGLDMYLHAKKYVSQNTDIDPDGNTYEDILAVMGITPMDLGSPDWGSLSVSVQVMYWRKANAIHDWFVKNVQDGEDDCRSYEVGREQLAELRTACERVLADHDLATELLPPADGFFFGGTELDEWYFGSIEDTKKALDKLLDPKSPFSGNPDTLRGWWFEYRSSW